jgi:hypothetical protein
VAMGMALVEINCTAFLPTQQDLHPPRREEDNWSTGNWKEKS